MTDDKLARLKARRAAKLKEAKALTNEIKKAEKKKQTEQRKADRRSDTRRKVLLGVAVSKEMEENPPFKAIVDGLVEKHLSRADERAVFGLPPVISTQQEKTDDNTQAHSPAFEKEEENEPA